MQCLFLALLHKDDSGQDASLLGAILNTPDILLIESSCYVIWHLFLGVWLGTKSTDTAYTVYSHTCFQTGKTKLK